MGMVVFSEVNIYKGRFLKSESSQGNLFSVQMTTLYYFLLGGIFLEKYLYNVYVASISVQCSQQHSEIYMYWKSEERQVGNC